MAYDKQTDSYMTDEEHRKLIKDRKREANRQKFALKSEKENKAKAISAPLSSEANKSRVQEFKRMLLHAPVGESVIRKVIDIARNDEHPGQMAAIKICMDRLLPVSLFEEKASHERPVISITISGVGDEKTIDGEVIE